ncbi:MAG: YkgJ family cysteine cluster protein [Alphaproteobacteria bacterium]
MTTNEAQDGLVAGRTCGSCVACCGIMNFDAPGFRKEAGVMCSHCSGSSCTIHATRPEPCRTFFCLWRRVGSMPDELRPDRIGVMFSIEEIPAPQNPFERAFVIARAVNSIADFDRPEVRAALNVFMERGDLPVWLSFNQERRLLHPRPELRDAILSSGVPAPHLQAEAVAWKRRLGLLA